MQSLCSVKMKIRAKNPKLTIMSSGENKEHLYIEIRNNKKSSRKSGRKSSRHRSHVS